VINSRLIYTTVHIYSVKSYRTKHSFQGGGTKTEENDIASYDNPIQAFTPVKSILNQSKTVPSTVNEMSEII